MDFSQDYYAILAVAPSATAQAIRASYRKLVYLYHPDRNPDNPEAEEKMKQINEANEVLSNSFSRSAYDEHRKILADIEAKAKEEEERNNIDADNKKTNTRTHTYRRELKVYVSGRIVIKYKGERLEDDLAYSLSNEINYRIDPQEVSVFINAGDIHREPQKIPADYRRVYSETELFRTPIGQPVYCTIVTGEGREEHYQLALKDIRVANPVITHTQKEESASFGTLEGILYAFVPKIEETKIDIPVTECFGETGKVEIKEENGKAFIRKESFNKNCSTFWGSWIEIPQPPPPKPQKDRKIPPIDWTKADGCGEGCWSWIINLIWIVPAAWLLFSLPSLLTLVAAVAVVGGVLLLVSWLLRLLIGSNGRTVSGLAYLLLIAMVIGAFFSRHQVRVSPQPKPAYDSLKTTSTPLPKSDTAKSTDVPDSLITHFIKWRDYDDTAYAIRLEMKASDVAQSETAHQQLDVPIQQERDINLVYQRLIDNDSTKLNRVYKAFDSLRSYRHLDELHFARAIVSCIQSVPYYLILDGNCDANEYANDAFIASYLAACNGDCCMGHVRYGVRSPAEMVGDLKGDCDSRALLLYAMLQHYHYSVALLTSFTYKHALIAVHFSGLSSGGTNLVINGQPYYLWETTNKGFSPGNIPSEICNTANWEVSLLNEEPQ